MVLDHQLRYDMQQVGFITSAEKILQEKWDEVWGHIHSLMDVAAIPQDVCLHLVLQVLELLPTISIDLSFCTPIPMMFACGPESYTSCAWLEDGEETSSLGKKARASCLLTKKLEWLAWEEEREDSSPGGLASKAHSCDSSAHGSPPSACHHQAATPTPYPGVPLRHINEVGPSQVLQAAATGILLPKSHTWALAQGVTLKLDPMEAMSQKTQKMRAPLARALAVMEDRKMKVQITKAPAARVGRVVRMRSQAVAVAAVPQSQSRRLERSNQMEKHPEVLQGLTPMPHNPSHCQKSLTRTLKMSGRITKVTLHTPRMWTLAHGETDKSV